MNLLDIVLLSFLQGLTEFLPISSTGHLIIFANFLSIPSHLEVDAFLHLGSFFAIILFFRGELKNLWKWKWLIVVSAIPGGIAGLALREVVEEYFRAPAVVGGNLLLMTLPMVLGEKLGQKRLTVGDLTWWKALFIGFAQALALIPGTSRSGITISAGLLAGLKRDEAAKYSFLAGAPLILGAGLYEGLKVFDGSIIQPEVALVGFIGSLISSLLAIAFLIPFLRTRSLNLFIIYRIVLGIVILLLVL